MGIRYAAGRIGRPREIGGRHVRKGREGRREGGPEDPRQAHRVRAGHGPEDAEAQGSLGHFLERFKGASTRRLHSCLMWFRWLREAARVGDRTSLMREQLDDGTPLLRLPLDVGRYEKIRNKKMEPEYEFHLEPDVQTAG